MFTIKKNQYPVNIDLIFRLIVILPLFQPYLFRTTLQLTFFDFFNTIHHPQLVVWTLAGMIIIGVLLTFFSIAPRLGCAFIAFGLFITMVSCRPCYSDSRFYIFSLLLLLILYQKKYGIQLLRLQVIVLYFGSGINKLFDIDWQTGQYIHHWLGYKLNFLMYTELSKRLPNLILAQFISWMVIGIELGMALLLTKKAYFRLAIWLGIVLHSISVVIANHAFGSFVAAVLISYIAFLEWPRHMFLYAPESKITRLLVKHHKIIDPYQKIHMILTPSNTNIILDLDHKKYTGISAIQQVILYCPIFYFLIILFALVPGFGYDWIKGAVLILISFLMLPVFRTK
ncbi:hypothetical protein [Aquimarina addita]|uniref:hypothetical protein n=1 Tax=Aquimarina addita TaxID=870485 RepID=UPI0031EF17AC